MKDALPCSESLFQGAVVTSSRLLGDKEFTSVVGKGSVFERKKDVLETAIITSLLTLFLFDNILLYLV